MSTVTINQALNLVIPLNDERSFVHCPPMTREAFASCWSLLAKTWSRLEGDNLCITAGAAVAAYALADIARQDDPESPGSDAAYRSFMAELRRNASYIGPMEEDGFGPVPLATALKKGWINDDDQDEIDNALVFFTLGSRLLSKERRSLIFSLMSSLRGVGASSLNATEYAASKQNSTQDAPTGATAEAS